MKLNKTISSALVLVMLLSSILAVLPISSMAAAYNSPLKVEMGSVDEAKNEKDALNVMIDGYLKNNYSTAAEMLADEIASGSLDKVSAGGFNLYVNRYSGYVFYENTKTGQILTSNPVDPYYMGSNLSTGVISQIELAYTDLSNPSVEGSGVYDSMSQIQQGFPLKVTEVSRADGSRGISVQYTLGVNAADFRVPSYILADDFVEHIAKPAFEQIAKLMTQYCGEGTIDYNINNNEEILSGNKYTLRPTINALNALDTYARGVLGNKSDAYKKISAVIDNTRTIFNNYDYIDPTMLDKSYPSDAIYFEKAPVLEDGVAVYRMVAADTANLTFYRLVNDALANVLGDLYTSKESTEDCAKTGYKEDSLPNSASFLVSINYYLDKDGNFSYEVPMSAPYFVNHNTKYTVQSITPLKYFGAGDVTKDGYIFFPDGSGSIIEFETIRNIQPNYTVSVYGNDYGYATLTSSNAHLEPTVMPIYGMVSEVNANKTTQKITGEDTITNGYFSIVEQGSSLANLVFSSGGSTHKYSMTYASYTPQPTDKCDLSETISVSGIGFYYVVSESVYDGVYRTNVTMLTDEKVATNPKQYAPTYIGMANCYRDYLEANGVIEKLSESETKSDLPLYIEVLGAMDVTEKILSVPVVVSTPLTTFEQVGTMYSELSGEGVKNINFRLSGFANGGMASTYPVKVTWENSVGGSDGIKKLLADAEKVNEGGSGANFGLYPDFDFLYIHNEEIFDGISYIGTTAIMVDNRYASKQTFNAVLQLYESMFSLVISADQYDSLYAKFNKEYSKYGFDTISVATLGSELNSNFDSKNAIHREDSLSYVKRLFDKMSSDYSIMTDVGNAYALEYADHILGAPLDSSHYKYSTYTVPFYGMVLHGYVNYAGDPINYSGFPSYDILRSIESGASLQYILCYENTNYLKDDPTLSKYYGVDYKNWKATIAEQYKILNEAIGDVQSAIISNHSALIGERIISRGETVANYNNILTEFRLVVSEQFEGKIASVGAALREADMFALYNGLVASIDKASLIEAAIAALDMSALDAKEEILTIDESLVLGFENQNEVTLYDVIDGIVSEIIAEFTASYPSVEKPCVVELSASDVNYTSQYNYNTDSYATDNDYQNTDYTCDNNNIVMVTYLDEATGKETVFFINYNIYDVKIRLDASLHGGIEEKLDESGYITVGASSFVKIQ